MKNFHERRNRLSNIYESLATEFLGKVVTLEYGRSSDRFVEIEYLIPKFDEEIRMSSDDCSEAQRFFLDIAFRMSIILLNYDLTKKSGTFICETPESALDVSYVDNVVLMFNNFISSGNKLILSNNLQRLGLAYQLVNTSDKTDLTIFDLLEHGRLSNVQKKSSELFEIRDEIMTGDLNE